LSRLDLGESFEAAAAGPAVTASRLAPPSVATPASLGELQPAGVGGFKLAEGPPGVLLGVPSPVCERGDVVGGGSRLSDAISDAIRNVLAR
jgi:hypothetical protein